MSDKYGECYCGDCISFNKCKSDKGTRINLISEGCSCFEPNDIAKVDYPILPKWHTEHEKKLLDKVADRIPKEFCTYCNQEACEGGMVGTIQECETIRMIKDVINGIIKEMKAEAGK